MTEFKKLYSKDLILESSAETKEEVLTEVGEQLYKIGLVTEEFPKELLRRENEFPTGLDLSIVNESSPNVAIPHTEVEYCKTKNIVFVKLQNNIVFNNMINPDQELEVKYLFMIINDKADNQTNVLSSLMDFFTSKGNIKKLESLNDKNEIYNFLVK